MRGLGKTRTGSIPVNIAKLVERTKSAAFTERVKQALVSDEEALEAARLLSSKGKARKYVEGGVIGGALSPAVSFGGNLAESVARKGFNRRALASATAETFSKPRLAGSVARGALGGGVIQAVREGVELGKAKRTVREFLKQHNKYKAAGVEPAPQSRGLPKKKKSDPWAYDSDPANMFLP